LLVIEAEDMARFLGQRVPLAHDPPLNSHLGRRHAGLRLNHSLGPASAQLHHKHDGLLRLEVTTYDVSFFRPYRTGEDRDGPQEAGGAARKKSLSSLRDLAAVLRAGGERSGQWPGTLVEPSARRREVERLGPAARDAGGRS
jgi:hypothetical protein